MLKRAFEAIWLIPQNAGSGTKEIFKGLSTTTQPAGGAARNRSWISWQEARVYLHSSSLEKEMPQHSSESFAVNCPFNNGKWFYLLEQ